MKQALALRNKLLLRYVNPKGPLPEIYGKKRGTLLIIGSSIGVWDDLRRYDKVHEDQHRMAVNDMMAYYPHQLQYGATLHTEKLPMWIVNQQLMANKRGWLPMKVHSHLLSPHVTHVWPLTRDGGTSGLFAVLVGLLMGYDDIVLAGIPCDGSPRFFEAPWKTHQQFGLSSAHDEWKRARDEIFNDQVRSLSGNTRKWLGAPEGEMVAPEEPDKPPPLVVQEAPAAPIVPLKDYSKVTVITPTGDRPEALFLLRCWMGAQTRKPDQWLIVGDGKDPLGHIHEAQVVRREPQPDDPACTLGENLKAAFPLVEHDKVLIMEDDDWYAPRYIEIMAGQLDNHELVGIWGTKYWHVGVPGFRNMGKEGHASLSQTGFRKSFIPHVLEAIPGDCSVDLRIWWHHNNGKGHLIAGAGKKLHCGIKGLPGRPGAGVGHDPLHFNRDPEYRMLQEWCDDWEVYRTPFQVRNRLVIYTAIAGNGDRDRLQDPEPIPGVDYVCFTDQPFSSKVWDVRPFVWKHKEAVRVAKHPKVLPHKYFPHHDLSIWVDGNILPGPDVQSATGYLETCDIALHRHPARRCLYREGEHLIVRNKVPHDLVEKTILRYLKDKMPHNFGLFEGGIIYRRHHVPAVVEAMEAWWKEIKIGSNRDQVPLAYIIWKHALPLQVIESNLRKSPYFTFRAHKDMTWEEIKANGCQLHN